MKKMQQGFTLIELMIVVAIIGILAAFAVPMYLDYTVRTQVGHGLNLASGAKAAVTEYYQDQGVFPADNATAGIETPNTITGKYITSVTVIAGGQIQVLYGRDVNTKILGATLTMSAVPNLGSVQWTCTGDATLVDKWLPPACRGAIGP